MLLVLRRVVREAHGPSGYPQGRGHGAPLRRAKAVGAAAALPEVRGPDGGEKKGRRGVRRHLQPQGNLVRLDQPGLPDERRPAGRGGALRRLRRARSPGSRCLAGRRGAAARPHGCRQDQPSLAAQEGAGVRVPQDRRRHLHGHGRQRGVQRDDRRRRDVRPRQARAARRQRRRLESGARPVLPRREVAALGRAGPDRGPQAGHARGDRPHPAQRRPRGQAAGGRRGRGPGASLGQPRPGEAGSGDLAHPGRRMRPAVGRHPRPGGHHPQAAEGGQVPPDRHGRPVGLPRE
mmetsp:Transcript_2281/g.6374  ORF Transcript_2281/g.6374 Transcript_2281/m.6374 type:complete len:291 (-) Transcript_2281:212-1084(-)